MAGCVKGCEEATTDETAIECDGKFMTSNCVVMAEDNPYFEIVQGDYLSEAIIKIQEKCEALDTIINNLLTL